MKKDIYIYILENILFTTKNDLHLNLDSFINLVLSFESKTHTNKCIQLIDKLKKPIIEIFFKKQMQD